MSSKWATYHNPLWGFFHQTGPVVYETPTSIGLSIPKFNGDYLNVKRGDDCLASHFNLSAEEKVAILSSFADWWYGRHKSIYQEVLVELLSSSSQ